MRKERKKKLKELGRHVLVELYGCEEDIINNVELVRKHLLEAARRTGATVVAEVFHQFSPHGVSGTVVIAESHLAIHTWPESGYCALDLYTCGDHTDPWRGFHYLQEMFKSQSYHAREIKRGIYEEENVDHDPKFVIRSISTNSLSKCVSGIAS